MDISEDIANIRKPSDRDTSALHHLLWARTMEPNNQGWPTAQSFDGFFTAYADLPAGARVLTEPNSGAAICYSISKNLYEEGCPRIRRIVACATLPDDDRPACWLRFDLIETTDEAMSDVELYDACDSISKPLERLAGALMGTCGGDIAEMLLIGPILHFERVEVRNDLRGKGLGMTLARCLIAELEERFSPSLLVVRAFPLQFQACAPENDTSSEEHLRFEKALAESQRKLVDLYEREGGLVRLGGASSEYWGAAMSGCELSRKGGHWAVA